MHSRLTICRYSNQRNLFDASHREVPLIRMLPQPSSRIFTNFKKARDMQTPRLKSGWLNHATFSRFIYIFQASCLCDRINARFMVLHHRENDDSRDDGFYTDKNYFEL